MFDTLHESPAEEVGVELASKVDDEAEDKGNVQAVKACRADTRGHRGAGTVAIGHRFTPQLPTVVALPDDVALVSVELEHHHTGAHGHGDEDDGPEEEADAHPHVGVVAQTDDVDDADRHDRHTDTTVDGPSVSPCLSVLYQVTIFTVERQDSLRVVEEEVLAPSEEEDGASKAVEGDEDIPRYGAMT